MGTEKFNRPSSERRRAASGPSVRHLHVSALLFAANLCVVVRGRVSRGVVSNLLLGRRVAVRVVARSGHLG